MLLLEHAFPLLDHERASVRVSLRLAVAVAASAIALVLVGTLEPAFGVPVLFPAFVGIVFVSAEVSGTRYAIVAAALFGAGYVLFFMGPHNAFAMTRHQVIAVLVAYGVSGLIVAWIGGALRKAYARSRDEHRAVVRMNEEREDLLKTLTHDLRTPLGAITLNAARLARSSPDPDVARRAHAIKKNATSVAEMLSDLVDTAQLESGHLPLAREPVDLVSFVVDLKIRLEGTLPLERVRLAIPDNLPRFFVDPRRFERILVNLLSNALKYAPPPTPVTVAAVNHEGELIVSVSDTGPGISQQDVPHVFDKYFRADRTRSREGLGIGLYATRLLVSAHGGRIWVHSKLGTGSTFNVALPLAPSLQRSSSPSAGSAAVEATRGAVLTASAPSGQRPPDRHPGTA